MEKIETAIEKLTNNDYDKMFKKIYIDEKMIDYQKQRYTDALKKYGEIFSENDEIEIFSAPGRSEICGNHTDHQHGKVIAASINLDTIAVVSKKDDNVINVFSDGYSMITVKADELEMKDEEKGTTSALIRGCIKGLKDRGYNIGGFNAYITSDVLVGAGLSSSAAFEVLIGTIISGLYNDMKTNPVEIAQISQYSENIYFGKPCGLMDQMACSVGGIINIDFKDPEKPVIKKIDTEFEKYNYSLCIVDTKGNHADLTDEYSYMPSEMKMVAKYMGKEYLRECNADDFYKDIANIRISVGDRAVLRAHHFFKEEENVDNAVSALEKGSISDFLRYIKKSGNSSYKFLQNVYTNEDVHNQSLSVALAVSEQCLGDNGVSRVHGGGFAGTIQAFVCNEFVDEYKKTMDNVFGQNSCHILKIRNYGGMKVI